VVANTTCVGTEVCGKFFSESGFDCNCDSLCFTFGDCCDDICDECSETFPDQCGACVPDCGDGAGGTKQCGDDGCGGSCGECTGGDVCGVGGVCAVAGSCCETSDCCVAHNSPGCNDPVVSACLGALDGFCVGASDGVWDGTCVNEMFQFCASECGLSPAE
jgi:hypothetical protein